ncbi:MAG: hypothetical protein Q8P41_27115 [Pseudomonadota bacterium]|nr:hypothetical protein [Pseudomonadota bacterium]
MSARRCLALVVAVLAPGLGAGCQTTACTTLGGEYSAHDRSAACCDDLTNYNLMVVPADTYEGDDLPEGCGVEAVPDDIMVCIECGDGVCGEAEHFCNCPDDCPRE